MHIIIFFIIVIETFKTHYKILYAKESLLD